MKLFVIYVNNNIEIVSVQQWERRLCPCERNAFCLNFILVLQDAHGGTVTMEGIMRHVCGCAALGGAKLENRS